MNEDFIDKLNGDYQEKPMTKKEMENNIKEINGFYRNFQIKDKNIYQMVTIFIMIICIIFVIMICYKENIDGLLTFIYILSILASGLFIYGFGEIIKQLKLINMQLSILNYQNNNKN